MDTRPGWRTGPRWDWRFRSDPHVLGDPDDQFTVGDDPARPALRHQSRLGPRPFVIGHLDPASSLDTHPVPDVNLSWNTRHAQLMSIQCIGDNRDKRMLASKLKAPITWKGNDPEIDGFLDRLQGNILKGHGRNNVVFMFCRFRNDSRAQALSFLKVQVQRVRSAKQQLQSAENKRTTNQKDKTPFVSIFLSRSGYDYFGVPAGRQPSDPAFQAGMAASHLNDPPQHNWDSHIRDPHLMILVGVIGPDEAQDEVTDLLNQISEIGDVGGGHSGELIGNQFFNDQDHGVENFGYVDGRSQPLVLMEDIPAEGGIDRWPVLEFPVDQFVVRDPATNDESAYGSYYVFRQLEQDVRGFKTREDELVKGHDNDFPNRDSAGVGRLESGTPFELSANDGGKPNITNNFVFGSNPPKCPHFAHIRKVNPRTPDTRFHLMIRRGITYGTRSDAKPKPGDSSMLVLDRYRADRHAADRQRGAAVPVLPG